MSKPYPWFFAVDDRLVAIVRTPDGDTDCLVLDMRTGNLVSDRSQFACVAPASGKDVDELRAAEFSQLVAVHRADIVATLAARMCGARTTSEHDLLAALGVALDPPPLAGTAALVHGGDIPTFDVYLPDGVLTRADFDARLGESRRLPRTGPYSSTVLRYGVDVPGAAHRCSVFARFREEPEPTSAVRGVLLRLDPAAVG